VSAVASTAAPAVVGDTFLEFRLSWRRRLLPVIAGALGVGLGISRIAEWLLGDGPAVLATDDPLVSGLLAIAAGGVLAGRGLRQRVVVDDRGLTRYQVFGTRRARWKKVTGVSVARDARGRVRQLFVWKGASRRACRPGRGLGARLAPLAAAVEAEGERRGIPVSAATRRGEHPGTAQT